MIATIIPGIYLIFRYSFVWQAARSMQLKKIGRFDF